MDLAKRLGAENDVSRAQKFFIYLPDRDASNQPISDIENWLNKAVWLMAEINGGCTRLPAAQGAWFGMNGQTKLFEHTVVIYSYLLKPESFEQRFEEIVEFLHDYGRMTNQDTVMAEFSGWAFDGEGYISEAYFIPSTAYAAVTK